MPTLVASQAVLQFCQSNNGSSLTGGDSRLMTHQYAAAPSLYNQQAHDITLSMLYFLTVVEVPDLAMQCKRGIWIIGLAEHIFLAGKTVNLRYTVCKLHSFTYHLSFTCF